VARHRLHPFERTVRRTARSRRLFGQDARVLVALSGGADSTALLAALAALRDAGAVAAVAACHVDHALRADSGEDAEFCERLCGELGVPLDLRAVRVQPGAGVQASARRARYAALEAAADAWGADRIATAHTRSDQAETIVHRLLRGSGARGLGAIPARRGRIVRPLLDVSRADVTAYLRARGLAWREDPSNASPRYLRNRIRREVLPALEALAPALERRLARTADLLRDDDRALEAGARKIAPRGETRATAAALLAAPVAIRRRAVRRLWRAATGARRDLGAAHVEAVLRLLDRTGPGSVRLPGAREARAAYGMLEIGEGPAPSAGRAGAVAVAVAEEGTYDFDAGRSVEIRWCATAPPPWPLELRTRRPGDRFRPAGARGGKKLKAWLIDRKVPRAERDRLVVVADPSGRVLALPDLEVMAEGADGLRIFVHRSPGDRASEGERCNRPIRLL
jgi:tRNA(Ile)-lysidine synthase